MAKKKVVTKKLAMKKKKKKVVKKRTIERDEQECVNPEDSLVLTEEALRYRLASIDAFVSITADAAALLAQEGRHQSSSWRDGLDGLMNLTDAVAENLAEYKGDLSLNGETSLAAGVADGLSKHRYKLSLGGLTSLSDAAAASLRKHQGKSLSLRGLKTLSDIAIKSLSAYKGSLDLSGLVSLSDASAQSLSEHKGDLALDGLGALSDMAAQSLSKHDGKLSLLSLASLSNEAAIALSNKPIQLPPQIKVQIQAAIKNHASISSLLDSKQQSKIRKLLKTYDAGQLKTACELLQTVDATEGDWLKLFSKTRIQNLLTSSDPKIWNSLASGMKKHPRVFDELINQAKKRLNSNSSDPAVQRRIIEHLTKLVEGTNDDVINDDVIELIYHARSSIELYSSSISDTSAQRLSTFQGELRVYDLASLSDTPGHLALLKKLCSGDRLDLYSLTSLSDSAAKILGKHICYLRLGLKSLSDAAAQSLGKHKGDLDLSSLTSLSDAAAESLSKHEGDLGLSSLKQLSDSAAKSLSKHKGNLCLWGLTELSDAAAESLGKHKGNLHLGGLKTLSDSAAESLSKHEGDLDLSSLKQLSDSAAESIGEHKGNIYLHELTKLSDAGAKSLSIKGNKLHCRFRNLSTTAAAILRVASCRG